MLCRCNCYPEGVIVTIIGLVSAVFLIKSLQNAVFHANILIVRGGWRGQVCLESRLCIVIGLQQADDLYETAPV